jgi:hypothetical protein
MPQVQTKKVTFKVAQAVELRAGLVLPGWEALSQRSGKVAGPYKLSIQAARSDKRSPRQPQESTTDCDKKENSQDTAAEEQICAFLRSRYLNHANYNGPKRRWFTNMAMVPPRE